jgi:hypothetical protein
MTTTTSAPTIGPAIILACPWCEAPVELPRDDDRLECLACLVSVDLAGPVVRPESDRALAPAA